MTTKQHKSYVVIDSKETTTKLKQSRQEWLRTWVKRYRYNNPTKHLYWLAKSRAKRKGIEFSIELSDINIPEYCPYLGLSLIPTSSLGAPNRWNTATLDRIDNTKGYIKDNIEVISWKANTMKSNATPEELVKFAKRILERNV